MIVKKRITNSSSFKGALFFVHNLFWFVFAQWKKSENGKTERRKQKVNSVYKQ